MLALLLLLPTFHETTEADTITLTELGDSDRYPWPAARNIRISITCIAKLPRVDLRLIKNGWSEFARISLQPRNNEVMIFCGDAPGNKFEYYDLTPDCSGVDKITYTVQLNTEVIRIN